MEKRGCGYRTHREGLSRPGPAARMRSENFAMSAENQFLLAGAGRRCTSPPPNIAHGGWGAQKHEQAEGIDMDLWVTALALSDKRTTALVLDIDIQIINNKRADGILEAVRNAMGLPLYNIRSTEAHTHFCQVHY